MAWNDLSQYPLVHFVYKDDAHKKGEILEKKSDITNNHLCCRPVHHPCQVSSNMPLDVLKSRESDSRLASAVDQQIILTARAQTRIAEESGFPVKKAHTAVDAGDDFAYRLDPLALARGRKRNVRGIRRELVSRVTALDGPIRFGHDELLAVFCGELLQRILQTAEVSLVVVEGVVADAHHVEVRGCQGALAEDGLVPPRLRACIPAVV